MTTTPTPTATTLGRALGRPALVALIPLGSLAALWVALTAALSAASTLGPHTRVPVYVIEGPHALAGPKIGEHATAEFTQAQVVTSVDVSHAKTLLAWGSILPSVVIVLACLVLVVLAVQLLRERPFATVLTASLTVLGILMLATAWASPALNAAGQQAVAEAAGLYLHPAPYGDYSVLVFPSTPRWDLAALGAIVLLLTVLVRRAHRYQADVEGLV